MKNKTNSLNYVFGNFEHDLVFIKIKKNNNQVDFLWNYQLTNLSTVAQSCLEKVYKRRTIKHGFDLNEFYFYFKM